MTVNGLIFFFNVRLNSTTRVVSSVVSSNTARYSVPKLTIHDVPTSFYFIN